MNRLLVPIAAALLLAPRLPAQDPGGASPQRVHSNQLEITTYTPTEFNSVSLRNVGNSLFGESFLVAPEGGGAFEPVNRFVVLGDLLLIRDTAESARKIVATLQVLEQGEAKRRKDAEDEAHRRAAAVSTSETDDSVATASTEFRPRNVAFEVLFSALKPLARQVEYVPANGAGWVTSSVQAIPDGNVIVVRETPTRLAQLKELVERIDRPRPQIAVSVLLVRAREVGGPGVTAEEVQREKALPAELKLSLNAMLPGETFELLSTGMLRCSAQSNQQCQVRMNLAGGGSWSLSFFPEAYDAGTAELSLAHCQFHCEFPQSGQVVKQDFDTSLTLETGEYVAIGAVGATPTFVVLRAVPVKRAQ